MRLNKYLAHCGLGTRRQTDVLIAKGRVAINGTTVTQAGQKVSPSDEVRCDGKLIVLETKKTYILMNKPKKFSCEYVLDEPKSIAKLISNKYKNVVSTPLPLRDEDRGLILLTDDEAVLKKLNTPDHTIKQVFQLTLDKRLKKTDIKKLIKGVKLDGGEVTKLHGVDYVKDEDPNVIGVESHTIDQDILHTLFEQLGYKIEILDRTYIAGLTKKDLPRGFFRDLKKKEVIFLKHFL